jgi:hypothetical protein
MDAHTVSLLDIHALERKLRRISRVASSKEKTAQCLSKRNRAAKSVHE